jgi:tyrosyl-tRNA synthetase
MLVQAADYQHLFRTLDCELQMGGADQWGNITAGLELIRRTTPPREDGAPLAYALAYPLLLAPSGAKFGKSEGGESVWLHPDGTSPYAFYQHWLNTDDRDVGTYLRWFTTFSPEQTLVLDAAVQTEPGKREAQRTLAFDITARVHGEEVARQAVAASEAAFSGAPIADPGVLSTLHRETGGFTFDGAGGASLLDVLVDAGIFASRGEARRMIQNGGLTVNEARVADADATVPALVAGEWLVVRVGKRKLHIGRRRDG